MSFSLPKIKEITITIHWSFWLLFFGLVFVSALLGDVVAILYVIAFVGLIGAMLLHELFRSLASQYFDYPVHEIILYPLGGIAQIEDMPESPKEEFLISLSGLITYFVMAGIVYGLGFAFKAINFVAFENYFGYSLHYYINVYALMLLILGGFNLLIPAIPFDAGRLVRSIFAIDKSYLDATQTTVQISKVLALLIGLSGFFFDLRLLLVAVVIYIANVDELQDIGVRYLLDDIKVKHVMTSKLDSVESDLTILEFFDYILNKGHQGYLVLDEQGHYLGVITLADARKVEVDKRDKVKVSEVMQTDILAVKKEQYANEALKIMRTKDIGRVFVEDPKSPQKYIGIITRSDIIDYLEVKGVKNDKDTPTRRS